VTNRERLGEVRSAGRIVVVGNLGNLIMAPRDDARLLARGIFSTRWGPLKSVLITIRG